jgi:hypothetical protein
MPARGITLPSNGKPQRREQRRGPELVGAQLYPERKRRNAVPQLAPGVKEAA